ncbi:MAG TPA: monovalent cation/H+ antiporter subunit D family protein [Methanosarcinales archaeon]|nr:monovalent cation/H+ antiporter subunit D family protein [Methanosarcinales archaeon]
MESIRPLLAVLVSAIAAIFILLSSKHKNIREGWTLGASIIKFSIIISMVPVILNGGVIEYTLIELIPGILFKFRVDAFGLFFGITSSFLWIFTSIYSIGYMRGLNEHAQTRYYISFAIALSSTIGIAFSANLFTLFIFYEILTLITYPLVIHKETPEAMRGGRIYLVYLLSSGVILLFAIILTYQLTGTLDFVNNGFLKGSASSELLRALFVMFIIGFGTKAALMPLQAWLPIAMIAPTPVSALLHAVAVVKAGVFGVIRVVYFVYGVDVMSNLNLGYPLAIAASITILLASMFALAEDNLKRRLAYSTVSQLSYIILGAALLTPYGLTGGILHIAFHAFMKITLFFCAGAIYVRTRLENISDMDGIGHKMPFTLTAFTIAAAGMAGTPAIAGFISKWYLCIGAMDANEFIFVAVLLMSALLNVAYFFPIIYNAFFKEPNGKIHIYPSNSIPLKTPLVLTAIGSIILGLFPDYTFLPLVRLIVGGIF